MSAYTTQFRIGFSGSIHKLPQLGDFLKIKSLSQGKIYADWSEAEKSKLSKLLKSEVNLSPIKLTYLASDSVFFFQRDEELVIKILGEIETLPLCSFSIAGSKNGIGESFDIEIHLRLLEGENKVRRFWLVPAFQYRGNSPTEKKFIPLCEYPLFDNALDLESIGFKNENPEDGWVSMNSFGEEASFLFRANYSKNGVEFNYHC